MGSPFAEQDNHKLFLPLLAQDILGLGHSDNRKKTRSHARATLHTPRVLNREAYYCWRLLVIVTGSWARNNMWSHTRVTWYPPKFSNRIDHYWMVLTWFSKVPRRITDASPCCLQGWTTTLRSFLQRLCYTARTLNQVQKTNGKEGSALTPSGDKSGYFFVLAGVWLYSHHWI